MPTLLLGGGIVAGALAGWAVGSGRGPALLARFASRAAFLVLVALLATLLVSSGFLDLAARASLAAVLGLLCGGLTQTVAMVWSEKNARGGSGRRRDLALASLLCLLLWALVLFAVPLFVLG